MSIDHTFQLVENGLPDWHVGVSNQEVYAIALTAIVKQNHRVFDSSAFVLRRRGLKHETESLRATYHYYFGLGEAGHLSFDWSSNAAR